MHCNCEMCQEHKKLMEHGFEEWNPLSNDKSSDPVAERATLALRGESDMHSFNY